ncbi:UPF0167 protein [Actinoallomurus iriomotensis]|uniref:UPF0167 protein n=1 Tax=Actinoallomurus iriomotensis TaxID=478107 RepID=A0A9W6SEX7_9ACTN|nr:UPF0167 protein [Actinoallomurus iriomotensis]
MLKVAELEELPVFVYHPDPVGTGSIKASEQACDNCSQRRGLVYTGPVYCEEEVAALCPWCIADGSAAERFDATYCDVLGPPEIDGTVVDAIARRTPGFSGWQQERWLFHCGDGAAFLGPAGARELRGDEPALSSLRAELGAHRWTDDQIDGYLTALDRTGQPTAYLFECRSCGTHLAYSDFT